VTFTTARRAAINAEGGLRRPRLVLFFFSFLSFLSFFSTRSPQALSEEPRFSGLDRRFQLANFLFSSAMRAHYPGLWEDSAGFGMARSPFIITSHWTKDRDSAKRYQ
jgi:hypothetical protein